MFIASKRNISIPSDDGTMSHFLPRDHVGPAPDPVAKTAHYADLVADGQVSARQSTNAQAVPSDGDTASNTTTKTES